MYMKKILFLIMVTFSLSIAGYSQVSKIVGKWKTIDDKDGTEKSIVYVFKATNGMYYGKVEKMFKDPDKTCTECDGPNKNQRILGMLIINNMIEKDGKLTGGTILDPKNGKLYKCNISIENGAENLTVRGSLDKGGLIGRSQTWIKVK